MACERINNAINLAFVQDQGENETYIKALIDPYNSTGSSNFVNFYTTKDDRWLTAPNKCPINWAILDSGWEGEFCRVVEGHPSCT